MDAREFENISPIILKVISKRYRGMNRFAKNYLTTGTWQDLTDYPENHIQIVFDLIDNGCVEREEDKQFCSSLLKFIGLIGSITIWIERANHRFYLVNRAYLLEIDDYIIKVWSERYNKNRSLYQNLQVFLQN